MKRVIIVPLTETRQFPGMEMLARGGSIAALVGDTVEERTRSAFDSDDSFFYSVASGQADLYTFNTLAEAARFAKGKIEALTALERSINTKLADATGPLKITPIAVPNPGRPGSGPNPVAHADVIISENSRDQQRETTKYSMLGANCLIFHNFCSPDPKLRSQWVRFLPFRELAATSRLFSARPNAA